MEYAVNLSHRADRDLVELFEYLDASNSAGARRWFNGLEKAIFGLCRTPRRCARAPEGRKVARPLYHLLHGTPPNVYRVLYEIDDVTKVVLVLSIRHGARDEWHLKKT